MQNQANSIPFTSTIDTDEVERFSRIADEWWNPKGKFKPLHQMNPARIGYIRDKTVERFGSMKDISLLDIGCGGGLLSEPMARLGAHVTAIDASERNIAVAKIHAEKSELEIDYRCASAEALCQALGTKQQAPFDVIIAMEIIEHVADVPAFIAASSALLKPGGLIFYSTVNRTAKAYGFAIIGAEYIMRMLPVGTHHWKRFLKPSEIVRPLEKNGVTVDHMTGMVPNLATWQWHLDDSNLSVNYMLVGRKSV